MLATRKGLGKERGFTLVEVTIILLVLVILSTIMLPQLGNFNRLARVVVVYEDVGAICASIKKFLDEVMLPGPFEEPGGTVSPPIVPVGLLAGPGAPPSQGLAAATTYNTTPAVQVWDQPIQDFGDPTTGFFTVTTDANTLPSSILFTVDRMDHHLMVNIPGGTAASTTPAGRYKNVIDDPSVGWFWGWRGPYFNGVPSDPWGGRYSVNTFGLHSGPGGIDDVYMTAVICISFGPNKLYDTEANMPGDYTNPGNAPNFFVGGDDIVAVLSAAGPF